jgi:hypothetical protein
MSKGRQLDSRNRTDQLFDELREALVSPESFIPPQRARVAPESLYNHSDTTMVGKKSGRALLREEGMMDIACKLGETC